MHRIIVTGYRTAVRQLARSGVSPPTLSETDAGKHRYRQTTEYYRQLAKAYKTIPVVCIIPATFSCGSVVFGSMMLDSGHLVGMIPYCLGAAGATSSITVMLGSGGMALGSWLLVKLRDARFKKLYGTDKPEA